MKNNNKKPNTHHTNLTLIISYNLRLLHFRKKKDDKYDDNLSLANIEMSSNQSSDVSQFCLYVDFILVLVKRLNLGFVN